MDMYDKELERARASIAASERDPDDFEFDMNMQAPDPDGAGMFTVAYDIAIRNRRTDKSLSLVGGIGQRWVERFEAALAEGHFD